MQKFQIFCFLCLCLCACQKPKASVSEPQHSTISAPQTLAEGDLIFQASQSSQSKAIQLATHSPYSHCGIIFEMEGNLYVFEAIEPVKFTDLQTWIARGEQGHYVVKRLKKADEFLSEQRISAMKKEAQSLKGLHYDAEFSWTEEKMYCSELVWKMYKHATGLEIGKLQKLKDFDLSNPLVRAKLSERYGKTIPENEVVISPAAIFDSELLETIQHK